MAQEEQCYSVEEARELINDRRYLVEEFIGAGAMACVYKVSERGTPNVYALKLLRQKFRERQQFLDIFQAEAIHMRDLQYPNIVRFYKFVQEENCAYILMDYVEGTPLTHEIQASRNGNGLMPLPKIVRIMAQIARAISYLHIEGYIHRDIKPGNVLLAGKDESALLTDLGIAGALDVQDVYGGAGTPSYMPYEQQTHQPIDQTADTYAFGIMLYEMFAGRKPFIPDKGMNFKEARAAIIELHRSEPVPSLREIRPELPGQIDDIFAQALAKNPAERYRDIMDFAQDVHEVLLPFLPDELKDFEKIRPQEIIRSAQPEIIEIEVPATQPRGVFIGGLLAIFLIAGLVIAGIYLNNRATPTATPSTLIVSNPIATELPVITPDDTNPPVLSETPYPEPNVLLSDIEAIGADFGESLSETVQAVLNFDAPFVPLRSLPNFYIELALEEAPAGSYGIAFAVMDKANYSRLRIDPASNQWLLETLSEGTVSMIQQGELSNLPRRLAISDSAGVYQLELDEEILLYNGGFSEGGTALYFEGTAPAIRSLQVGVIGENSLEMPSPLSPMDYLLEDLGKLQSTGDASAIVQCPDFVAAYERLEPHFGNSLTGNYARNAQSLSAFIYSRCIVADEERDFNDSYSDYLAWESGLEDLLNTIGQSE